MVAADVRARYDALCQIIEEMKALGRPPMSEWLQERLDLERAYPDLIAPPVEFTAPEPPAPPPLPPAPPPPAPPTLPTVAATIPASQETTADQRVSINVDEDMNRCATMVLQVWGKRFCVFHTGGDILVEVRNDPRNPGTKVVGPGGARRLAARECKFGQKRKTKDDSVATDPILAPEWLGTMITSRASFPEIPPLRGLVRAPTLRSDGALIATPGYEPTSGIFLTTDLEIRLPDSITRADATRALDTLLDLVVDFDFKTEEGKTAWVAGLLAVVARYTFDGPAPLNITDASKRGSGKSTLADLVHVIAFGERAPRSYFTRDNTEMDKRIMSLGVAGAQMVLLDNIAGKLESEPLEAALTSTSYTGRLLGRTEQSTIPMKIIWFATANGMIISEDIARRSLITRLEPQCDNPEERDGPRPGERWKYPYILEYAKANRTELLRCALAIVAAYIRAGRPDMKLRSMGSYDEWSRTIRSAIVWAGGKDPCLTADEAKSMDPDKQSLERLMANWPVSDMVEITAHGLLERADLDNSMLATDAAERSKRELWRHALLEWLPAKRGDLLPTARDLGYALRAVKGNWVDGYKIERGKITNAGIHWHRERHPSAKPLPADAPSTTPAFAVVK